MKSKFRTERNQLITGGLFKEEATSMDNVLYSLAREDNDYPSLYLLYMNEADLTEFSFAKKYFESFQHWKKICSTNWMHVHIVEWREELELMIRAKALQSLLLKSEQSTEVAKYLLNNNWVSKMHDANPVVNLRGRPTKQEIKNHLTLVTNEALRSKDDYERIKSL
jgi:hypothetical protein